MAQHGNPSSFDAANVRFAANDVRLSLRDWFIAVAVIGLGFWIIPAIWRQCEPLNRGPDHRVPYRLGNDYWNYDRTCREACRDESILLVGDSVVWGHYVDTDGTLSHYLNERSSDGRRFDNLGVDGIHPVALAGLIRYYGRAVHDKSVVINCNPLWLSSPRHDLSSNKESQFNHPALVPQFVPSIPSYKAKISERVGTVVARHVPFFGWADHVRIAYFDNDDLTTWTIEHPYLNPAGAVTWKLPSSDEPPSPTPDPRPWTEKGIRQITPEWVSLDESLQWRFFRQTVGLLQRRGNQVFVLIGPLNEHMLSTDGLKAYNNIKQQIVAWHVEQGIPHYAPSVLPSEVYADLSHPNAEGYAQLAERMLAQPEFASFRDGHR